MLLHTWVFNNKLLNCLNLLNSSFASDTVMLRILGNAETQRALCWLKSDGWNSFCLLIGDEHAARRVRERQSGLCNVKKQKVNMQFFSYTLHKNDLCMLQKMTLLKQNLKCTENPVTLNLKGEVGNFCSTSSTKQCNYIFTVFGENLLQLCTASTPVTPQAQNTGTSPGHSFTGSP